MDTIRKKQTSKLMNIEEAVNSTIDEMSSDFEIRTFLIANRAEVTNMCLTEYNEEETMQLFKKEGREEGREEAIISAAQNVMASLKCTAVQALTTMGIPLDEQKKYISML